MAPEELTPAPEPNSGIEDGSTDDLSFAHWSNRIAERTNDITEQHWGNSHQQDKIPRSDHGGGSIRSEDEEDVDLNIQVMKTGKMMMKTEKMMMKMILFLSLMLPVFLLGICLVNALSVKRHL